MATIKVDFLDNLDKTKFFIKSNIKENDKIVKLSFYTPGSTDDNNAFERNYYSIDSIDLDNDSYKNVEKISIIIQNDNILKSILCDKKNNLIIATDNRKSELKQMVDDTDINNIQMDDNCTYYKFEFGIIGKYDPNTSSYYIYEDGDWKMSGEVMRWVEDPAYDYEIINKSNIK